MLHRIKHLAIIEKLLPDGRATVRISDADSAGCSGCHIAALCSRSGGPVFDVVVPGAVSPAVGDRVEISIPAAGSRRATVVLLLLPLAVLIVAMACAYAAGCSEAVAVIISLGALAATFITLLRLRRIIESPVRWTITRIIYK